MNICPYEFFVQNIKLRGKCLLSRLIIDQDRCWKQGWSASVTGRQRTCSLAYIQNEGSGMTLQSGVFIPVKALPDFEEHLRPCQSPCLEIWFLSRLLWASFLLFGPNCCGSSRRNRGAGVSARSLPHPQHLPDDDVWILGRGVWVRRGQRNPPEFFGSSQCRSGTVQVYWRCLWSLRRFLKHR